MLFLWSLVADYLTEEQYLQICHCLELCTQLTNVPTGKDCDRLGCTLMQHFVALSHLIQSHDNVSSQNLLTLSCLGRCTTDVRCENYITIRGSTGLCLRCSHRIRKHYKYQKRRTFCKFTILLYIYSLFSRRWAMKSLKNATTFLWTVLM